MVISTHKRAVRTYPEEQVIANHRRIIFWSIISLERNLLSLPEFFIQPTGRLFKTDRVVHLPDGLHIRDLLKDGGHWRPPLPNDHIVHFPDARHVL